MDRGRGGAEHEERLEERLENEWRVGGRYAAFPLHCTVGLYSTLLFGFPLAKVADTLYLVIFTRYTRSRFQAC